jgi:putative ABC transport system substrate-binding protein
LRELVPNASVIGFLFNPNSAAFDTSLREYQSAAASLSVLYVIVRARTAVEIDAAFDSLSKQGISALVVANDAFLTSQREQIVALAKRYAIPSCYGERGFVTLGGLISYAPDPNFIYHQAGTYTGRILKGAHPADLPVVQPTKYQLVINVKTAKTLGLTVPPTLLTFADEVIE